MSDIPDQMDSKQDELLMQYVLEHYIKHNEVVLKKLGHARHATHQSIEEIGAKNSQADGQLKEMEGYDEIWSAIIEMFQEAGVSEEELVKIEEILTKIPRLIKKYYDVLVQQDKILQELMAELASEKYVKAMAAVKKVQSKPDLLSGLMPEEFAFEHSDSKNAYIYKIPKLKDTLH